MAREKIQGNSVLSLVFLPRIRCRCLCFLPLVLRHVATATMPLAKSYNAFFARSCSKPARTDSLEDSDTRGLPYMTSAGGGGGRGSPKSRRKEQNQLICYSDKGEGVKKSENFADVIYGSPLCIIYNTTRTATLSGVWTLNL